MEKMFLAFEGWRNLKYTKTGARVGHSALRVCSVIHYTHIRSSISMPYSYFHRIPLWLEAVIDWTWPLIQWGRHRQQGLKFWAKTKTQWIRQLLGREMDSICLSIPFTDVLQPVSSSSSLPFAQDPSICSPFLFHLKKIGNMFLRFTESRQPNQEIIKRPISLLKSTFGQ